MKPAQKQGSIKPGKEKGEGVSHKAIKLTILGGSARSEALPFFVRLSTMDFKILCLSKIMALCPS